jgi:hypothetical protein
MLRIFSPVVTDVCENQYKGRYELSAAQDNQGGCRKLFYTFLLKPFFQLSFNQHGAFWWSALTGLS